MRPFLWIAAFMSVVAMVLVPVIYLYIGAQLPTLESEFDLERLLKQSIESERKSVQLGLYEKSKLPINFVRPDFARLPKNLVAFQITERGCPTFFQTPREEGFRWAKRVMLGVINIEPEDSDGWCEHVFAQNLAVRIGAKGKLEQAVAIYKIHRFLKKDGLIAYDLHSMRVEEGVIGVEDAAKELFKKPLTELTLSQLAEFQLALPPHGYWSQMRSCQNPILIKQNRDIVIDNLRRMSLVPDDLAKSAQRQPVACTQED
ncbi:MAG: transglycosylase domain-containing protein [Myxococcaceae bacterium]|nr:transglycosylase domain-containing protein [Myxococcaceae bacterium]